MSMLTRNKVLGKAKRELFPISENIDLVKLTLFRTGKHLLKNNSDQEFLVDIVDYTDLEVNEFNGTVYLTETFFMNVESDDEREAIAEAYYKLNSSNINNEFEIIELMDFDGKPHLLGIVNTDINYVEFSPAEY